MTGEPQLPGSRSRLIGREELVADLLAALVSRQERCLALIGMRCRGAPDPLEILSTGQFDEVYALLAPGFTDHTRLPGRPSGLEGLIATWRATRTAFPDLRYELLVEVIDADRIAHRIRATGTHRGEFLGVPATERQVSWEELHIVRHDGDRILEHWGIVDVVGLMSAVTAEGAAAGAAEVAGTAGADAVGVGAAEVAWSGEPVLPGDSDRADGTAIDRRAVAREAIEAVFGRGDLDAADRYYASEHQEHIIFAPPGGAPIRVTSARCAPRAVTSNGTRSASPR